MRPGQTAPEFTGMLGGRKHRNGASMRPGQTAPEFQRRGKAN